MVAARIGLIANPASGKDIRRLTANASVFDNQEKSAIVKRFFTGLAGVHPHAKVTYYDDTHHIARSALKDSPLCTTPLEMCVKGMVTDSTEAAAMLQDSAMLVTLGGDGTNRAVAKGWPSALLIALSTGTNTTARAPFC